jgi:hypothetical protein
VLCPDEQTLRAIYSRVFEVDRVKIASVVNEFVEKPDVLTRDI